MRYKGAVGIGAGVLVGAGAATAIVFSLPDKRPDAPEFRPIKMDIERLYPDHSLFAVDYDCSGEAYQLFMLHPKEAGKKPMVVLTNEEERGLRHVREGDLLYGYISKEDGREALSLCLIEDGKLRYTREPAGIEVEPDEITEDDFKKSLSPRELRIYQMNLKRHRSLGDESSMGELMHSALETCRQPAVGSGYSDPRPGYPGLDIAGHGQPPAFRRGNGLRGSKSAKAT